MSKFYAGLMWLAVGCLGYTDASAGEKVRAFFTGNSYTYTNNMPQMIADVAASMGDTLVWEEHTVGGYTWKDHWSNFPSDPCVAKIKTGNWNYVVLQEQSQMPAFGVLGPTHPTYIYATQFTTLIRDSAVCTTPMFYMTWGYKNGDASNCPGLQYMCTYLSMDSVIRMRYLELADSFNAVVSPVGAVRRYVRQHHAGIELYTPDGSHPSVAGTYAAACGFYAAMFKKDPTQVTFNSTVPAADAANIRAAAKKVVYDSLGKWGLGVYDMQVAYDHSVNGTKVTFTNQSSAKALTYSWNFGDGHTSALKNPVHTYAAKGEYIVTLTAYDAKGCSRVITKKVSTAGSGIDDVEQIPFSIAPNPARDKLAIDFGAAVRDDVQVWVTDIYGRVVTQTTLPAGRSTYHLQLDAIAAGVYLVKVQVGDAVQAQRLVVE